MRYLYLKFCYRSVKKFGYIADLTLVNRPKVKLFFQVYKKMSIGRFHNVNYVTIIF